MKHNRLAVHIMSDDVVSEDAALAELELWLRRRVAHAVPDQGTAREDIVAAARADFWRYRQSMHDQESGAAPERNESLLDARGRAIAAQILRRRVADHYRHAVARGATSLESQTDRARFVDGGASPLRAAHHRTIYAKVLQMVTALPAPDRELLLRDVVGDLAAPLSAAERQKLYRLRRALRSRVTSIFGEPLEDLLNDD